MMFSVIIPVYNRELLLVETVKSVLVQSCTDFELIIVNDGSTDSSGEEAEAMTKTDHRIRVIHQENKGRCFARNAGMEQAKGTWFCLLDSDDTWVTNHLETFRQAIDAHPSQRLFATSLVRGIGRNPALNAASETEIGLPYFVTDNPISLLQVCFHRSFFDGGLRFEVSEPLPIGEDWLFMRELVANESLRKIGVVTAEIREHEARSMNLLGAETIARCNVRSTELFLMRHQVPNRTAERMRAHALRLGADVLHAGGHRAEAMAFVREITRFPRAWLEWRTWWTAIKCLFIF